MADTLLLAAVAVIGFVGGVAGLIPIFADLAGHPVAGWRPLPRVVTAALLLVSLVAGMGAYLARQRANTPEAVPLTQDSDVETTVSLPATTPTPSPSPVDHSKPSPASPIVPTRPVTPRLRIADASGASIPQLVAAAKDLRHEYALYGVLQERSEQAPELQDLYTVHLTLSATVTRRTDVVEAFSVRSRGGGFQIEAARAQALDRMATALQARLAELR